MTSLLQTQYDELLAENAALREALQPFARCALTRSAKTADDYDTVEVPMIHCREALRVLGA